MRPVFRQTTFDPDVHGKLQAIGHGHDAADRAADILHDEVVGSLDLLAEAVEELASQVKRLNQEREEREDRRPSPAEVELKPETYGQLTTDNRQLPTDN